MADDTRILQLPFPVKGVNRFAAYSRQPELTSPDMINVRAFDPTEARGRGGQRPGLRKLYTMPSATQPTRLIAQVARARTVDSFTGTDEDNFDWVSETQDNLGSKWETADWAHHGLQIGHWMDSYRAFDTNRADSGDWEDGYGGDIRKSYTFDGTGVVPYSISFLIVPTSADNHHLIFLLLRMNDVTPDLDPDSAAAEGVVIKLELTGVTGTSVNYDMTLTHYVAGTPTDVDWGSGTVAVGWPTLKVTVTGNNIAATLGDSATYASFGPTLVPAMAGHRVGLMLTRYGNDPVFIDNWFVTGIKKTGEAIPRETRLVCSQNAKLYVEADASNVRTPGVLAEVTVPGPLNNIEALMATPIEDGLVIADFAVPRLESALGHIGGAAFNELTVTGIADWATVGVDLDSEVCVIINDSDSGPVQGVYRMTGIDPGDATIMLLATNLVDDGDCSIRIEVAPKFYNPGANTVTMLTQDVGRGAIPTGCRICCSWRGRLVFANSRYAQQQWYMSRQGDMHDWDYTLGDAQCAISGVQTEGGELAEPVRAVIPFSADYLVIGCNRSLWVLRGDPAAGGTIHCASREVGVLDRFAWCQSPDGSVYFMAEDGFYNLSVNELQGYPAAPRNLSATVIASELSAINIETHDVSLIWDRKRYGVCIHITPKSTGSATHWFYDARTQGFFPEQLPDACGATYLFDHDSDTSSFRRLLLGGRDGKLRTYDEGALNDDGTAIASFVKFPTIPMSPDPTTEGVLTYMQATLPTDSLLLNWRIFVGKTAEASATSTTANAAGTWDRGGYTKPSRQRVRGAWMTLWARNLRANRTWGMEQVTLKVRPAGHLTP